jgi:hypothetical protein
MALPKMKRTKSTLKSLRAGATRKKRYTLHGGPYHAQSLWLATPITMTFSTPSHTGRYIPGTSKYTPANEPPIVLPIRESLFDGNTLVWEPH